MGWSIIKVHFTKKITNPTKNCEVGFNSLLKPLIGYYIVSTISKDDFYNLGENIPEKSVVCVPPTTRIFKSYEKVYRDNIEKAVSEDLRRELIHYGMV